jgi:5-methylcytosine-specific restriction protein B
MARQPERDDLYAITTRFVDECLRRDGSLFTPDRTIWSTAILEDLYERFAGHPDTSGDPFNRKLARQLADAPDTSIQLMGEVLFIHFLPAAGIGGVRKREVINDVLGWMEEPVDIPEDLAAVLDTGLMKMGVAFNTGRPFALTFLLDFARAWKAVDEGRRDNLLQDPWAFKAFVFELPIFAAHGQREGLLHLVHPDTFESIASRAHKRDIAAALSDRVADGGDDVDRRLVQIRESLEREKGRSIEFYEPGIYERWQPVKSEPAPEDAEAGSLPVARRAWLVRGTTKSGESLVPQWLQHGFVSIGWAELGPMEPGVSKQRIRDQLHEREPEGSLITHGQWAGIIHRFLTEMSIGDLVVSPQHGDIYVGVVTSDPTWRQPSPSEPPQLARRRDVEWTNAESPVERSSLSEGLYSMMRTLLTVTEVTDYADEIALIASISDEVVVPRTATTSVTLPPANPALEQATLLPHRWLQEVLDLLQRKRQVVFYGPPGTGKTFVAQKLGDHIVAAGGNFRVVQFHPSYSYEDFFEGFRPRAAATDTGVGFELVGGPLRAMAEAALDDPSHPYLLIIDEINRGNIAKVFGELYFLLEYRDAAVSLLYSPEEDFQLPKNLYIIGTMNTADRSIALIDTAMRRRFYFFRFSPEDDPINSILRRWLESQGIDDEPAQLLDALNAELDDPDFAIGPSYLMDARIRQPGEVERVWTHAIIPLLEEHYFGTEVDVQHRFGLDALRGTLQGALPAESSSEDIDAS